MNSEFPSPHNSPSSPKRQHRLWKAFIALLGTIILGAVGSGVWDVLAKPGLGRAGRAFLGLVTFGSTRVKDLAYSMAALDPFPLPALLLVAVVILVLPFALGFLSAEAYYRPRLASQEAELDQLAEDVKAGRVATENVEKRWRDMGKQADRQIKRITRILITITAIFLVFAVVGHKILTQAVLIRRVFDANVRICAPFVTDAQEKSIRGRFAAMRRHADFEPLAGELRDIAAAHSVTLRPEPLW